MKRKILLPLLMFSSLTFVSCGNTDPIYVPVIPSIELVDIIITPPSKTVYEVDDELDLTGLEVVASYSDGSSKTLAMDEYQISDVDMSTKGNKTIYITYEGISKSFVIVVEEKEVPVTLVRIYLKDGQYKTEYEVGDKFFAPDVYGVFSDGSERKVDASFSGFDSSKEATDQIITVTYLGKTTSYKVNVSKTTDTYSVNLVNSVKDLSTLDGTSLSLDRFNLTINKNGGNTPIYSTQNGKHIRVYTNNTFTISCDSRYIVGIDIPLIQYGSVTVDNGNAEISDSHLLWSGYSKSITFTVVQQIRFIDLNIKYEYKEPYTPSISGLVTIKDVYDEVKNMEFVPNAVGYDCSNVEVSLAIKALDTIDSAATSEGYDGDTRGKVLVTDGTGYIICSSSTSTNNPVSFYQRVKDYLKADTVTYTVTGYISIYNDVIEIKVSSYQYDPNIRVHIDYESFVDSTYTSGSDLINDELSYKVNNKGYGIGKIKKMKGLTYFNKYNSAGSYLFLDQDNNIVPVFSDLDKDRASLVKGQVYDIIGLESLYRYRPSFRILDISPSTSEAVEYDFDNDVIELTTTKDLYRLNPENNMEAYKVSELQVYKMTGYVSCYRNDDKYSINTEYYKDTSSKEYSTGVDGNAVSDHYSLLVFNEDVTYKQLFADFVINGCKTEDEVLSKQVTFYFTLAFNETLNKREVWRVNIIEELMFTKDYYDSKEMSMTFDLSDSSNKCDRNDGEYQSWYNTSNSIRVTNRSTDIATIERSTDYLKIVDGTSLTISCDKKIVGFTLYTGTYSYIAGLGSFEFKAYKQYSTYSTFLLKEYVNVIFIDDFMVGSNHNNPYLKVTSITINYLEA